MERRRYDDAGQNSMAILEAMPALVVLERFPVPVLAIGDDGRLLFVNTAFGQMVGRTVDDVLRMTFFDLFAFRPDGIGSASDMRAVGSTVVDLKHADGSLVRASMSRSALVRDDDPVNLATFQDLTERLWIDEI